MRVPALTAALAASIALIAPGAAGAAVITPNTTEDQFDEDASHCSLREAVWTSDHGNQAPFLADGCTPGSVGAADTIRLPAGRYQFTRPADSSGNSFDKSTGDLDLSGVLTVEAEPGADVTIDANQQDRIFTTFGGQLLTIDGLTLTGGFVDSPGAGSATSGGAISTSVSGPLTLTDSTVVDNRADGIGGAISTAGNATISNSTIAHNTSTELGPGGAAASGTLTLDHSTVSGNVGDADGRTGLGNLPVGGVAAFGGGASITTHNSIIAGNSENAPDVDRPDCSGTVSSTGGNVIGSTAGCTFTAQASDSTNDPAGPGLSSLNDRGGPTQTHGLLAGSPAIDRGVAPCAVTDQRGVTRAGLGNSCDSGAFELALPHTLTVTPPTNGTIVSNGNGIDCPGDCTETFPDGSNIPLTPTPAPGFVFTGWTGDCTGTGSCSAVMDADRTIGATFTPLHTLTVTVTGPGEVTGPGIDCPGDCTEDYLEGTAVSLTQTADAGARFDGWAGDCMGTGACDLTMAADRSVEGTFSLIPPPPNAGTPPGSTAPAVAPLPQVRKCKRKPKKRGARAAKRRCGKKRK
jgi:CSLREA domain-containing protein/uncharacterized repeat protein (TIGR02543 family)